LQRDATGDKSSDLDVKVVHQLEKFAHDYLPLLS
jgi:hypothetical protein